MDQLVFLSRARLVADLCVCDATVGISVLIGIFCLLKKATWNPNGTIQALNLVSLSLSFSSAVARVCRAGQLRRPAVQHRPQRGRPRQARAVVQEQLFPPRLHVSNWRRRNQIVRHIENNLVLLSLDQMS